jgi:hypothetical protein
LDANTALYEWNYPKQMLRIKLEEVEHGDKEAVETEIFSQDYLIKRPLLEAIQSGDTNPPVLLIDEIDRADMEFEAFLLEVLSDFQITIPEIGTVAARHRPYVFLTSNRTREIHDALKRRCLYHWIEYPSFEKEYEIITTKFPDVEANMARQICAFMQRVRQMNFYKRPGVAETLDWAGALAELDAVARRNAQKIRGPPDQVALEVSDRTIGIDDLPHHFDHTATPVLVQGMIDHAGEMIEIDRLLLGSGRLGNQFLGGSLVEAELPLDDGVQFFALPRRNVTVDAGRVDEQRSRGETIVVMAEMGRMLVALRDVREKPAKAFEHIAGAVIVATASRGMSSRQSPGAAGAIGWTCSFERWPQAARYCS